jgi:hypothetical protein
VARPSFKPTRDQRKLVKSLAALGLPQQNIATAIDLRSTKTLRKHFRHEITLGTAEANAAVARVAFEMAASGKWPGMTRYWLTVVAPMLEATDDAYEHDWETDD